MQWAHLHVVSIVALELNGKSTEKTAGVARQAYGQHIALTHFLGEFPISQLLL